jgi:hypothetical protein
MLEEIKRKTSNNAKIYPGLFAGFIESDPEDLLRQIHIVRKLKLDGAILFDWAHLNEDLIGFYSKLGEIREKYREIFKDGEFCELIAEEGFFFYKRTKNEKCVYVYTNNSSKSYSISLPETCKDCFSGKIYENEITVEPYSYKIFVKENEV